MYKYFKNGYYISNKGKIKRIRIRNGKPELIKLNENTKGYYYFYLLNTKNKEKYYVHRIVAQLFLEQNKGKYIVDHIDGNRKNNNVTNLRWVTISENNLNRKCHREREP